jgi:putative ABC transport system substrate-binding protein
MIARRRWLRLAALLPIGARLAHAQGRVARLGYLMPRSGPGAMDESFVARMGELGYAAGRNLAIEYRWAAFDMARLQSMADELARAPVDVIVTASTPGTRAAMQATRTIPIVIAAAADVVGAKLVASLARPGGNVTGVSLQTTDVASKRLQLVLELLPGVKRVALLAQKLGHPAEGTTALLVAETAAAARTLGVALLVREVSRPDEFGDAFAAFAHAKAEALIVQVSPLLVEHRSIVVGLAARDRLPAIYEARDFVDAGGLASYGPDLRIAYRRAADYVHRILTGARASDLPVERADTLTLAVNVEAAKALGVKVPASVMLRAERVP